MFKSMYATWKAFRPSSCRQDQCAQPPAALEGPCEAELASKEETETKLCLQAYKAHLERVDLNEIATLDGNPMDPFQIGEEVRKRMRLAIMAKRGPKISLADQMSDDEIAVVSNKLDQTALKWLLKHTDPDGQRAAANAILRTRADFDEVLPLDLYVTIVAEAVARSVTKYRANRIEVAVTARAILLRALDPRWTRIRRNELRPLSKAHW